MIGSKGTEILLGIFVELCREGLLTTGLPCLVYQVSFFETIKSVLKKHQFDFKKEIEKIILTNDNCSAVLACRGLIFLSPGCCQEPYCQGTKQWEKQISTIYSPLLH